MLVCILDKVHDGHVYSVISWWYIILILTVCTCNDDPLGDRCCLCVWVSPSVMTSRGGDEHVIRVKLMLIGDTAVGKTSILVRFIKEVFDPIFITTIGNYVTYTWLYIGGSLGGGGGYGGCNPPPFQISKKMKESYNKGQKIEDNSFEKE